MIYYFSGTGNSYAVAKKLAEALGEELTDIAEAVKAGNYKHTMLQGERLGFVFPVYAWAPPQTVTDFVKNLELYYSGDPYLFAVCTCGSSAGETIDLLRKALQENGLTLDSGFSVVMPDSFTVLFDAGTKAEQYALLEKADRTLDNILRAIRLNWSNFFRVKKGRGAGVLSKIVNPAFRRGLKTKPFYVTESCSHCGLCERVCTSGCIRLTAGIPVWTEKRCNMCMACVNRCPQTAIQYGKGTTKRGRCVHPIYQNRKGESE